MARPWGARRARSTWCSRRWVFRAGWSSAGNVSTVLSKYYRCPSDGCPGHLCATHTAGYLNFATAAGAIAIHGHGGTAVVTVTRGPGDVYAHCRYAAVGWLDSQMMVGVRTPVRCS